MSEYAEIIPLTECVKGRAYRIQSRNLIVGVWNGRDGFVGIREKFDSKFLFTEYHSGTGSPLGTASPWKDLGACPVDDLREYLGTRCDNCGCRTGYVDFKGGPKTKTYGSGDKAWTQKIRGQWRHLERPAKSCRKIASRAVPNPALFDWLEQLEISLEVPCAGCGLPHVPNWKLDDPYCFRRECWDARCKPCPTCGIRVLDSDGTQICERCTDPLMNDLRLIEAMNKIRAEQEARQTQREAQCQ